jgi:hypothetical protein
MVFPNLESGAGMTPDLIKSGCRLSSSANQSKKPAKQSGSIKPVSSAVSNGERNDTSAANRQIIGNRAGSVATHGETNSLIRILLTTV